MNALKKQCDTGCWNSAIVYKLWFKLIEKKWQIRWRLLDLYRNEHIFFLLIHNSMHFLVLGKIWFQNEWILPTTNNLFLKYNALEQFYTSKEKKYEYSKWVCFSKCYNQPKRKMKTIKFGWVSVETFLIEKICTILLFSKCVVTLLLLLLLLCLFWKWRLNRHTRCVEKKVLSYHKLNHQWRWHW